MKNKSTAWWVFFPFTGLDITDKKNGLISPIFGDVAIVSKKHIGQIIQNLKLDEHMPSENAEFIADMIENPVDEFQSYIAVRRTGILNADEYLSKPALEAKERAEQIAALLALVFLARSTSRKTCGLVEQIHSRVQSISMLDLENGGFSHSFSSVSNSSVLDAGNLIEISAKELTSILEKEEFKSLAQIILLQKSSLSKSLRNTTIQSSVRLMEAVHSPKFSTMLLGAVTAIEMLITDQPTDYKIIKNRITTLVGKHLSSLYDLEKIMETRHEYVHKGKEVSDDKIATKALALALSCILAYSDIVTSFKLKSDLLSYFDFVIASGKIENNWSSTQKKNFQTLLQKATHRREFSFAKSES